MQHIMDILDGPRAFGFLRRSRRHLQPRLAGQILDRIHEVHAVMVRQPADGIAMRAAAKAVIEALVVIDGEAGRLLAMEGTACLVLRSEEHTSELQSLMRISYAVFCL